MYIEANNMYEAWVKVNERFIQMESKSGMLMSSRDYTRVYWPVRLHVAGGFGFDESNRYELPSFYANYQNRIRLLANRYIDSELWEEGISRIKTRERRMSSRNPLSFVIQFHRRPTNERKVPAGGGCLTQITFVWYQNLWHLNVTLRASEITAALIGDIAFVQWVVEQVKDRVRLKNWDDGFLEIVWDIALASQMKSIIPLFLLYTRGDLGTFEFLFRDPSACDPWLGEVIEHFWETFIYLEKVTWHRRQRWTKRFLEATNVDWQKAHEKWRSEFGADI